MQKTEFRVRPVTRYVVTRYDSDGLCSGSKVLGEYGNEEMALMACKVYEVLEEHHRNPPATPKGSSSFMGAMIGGEQAKFLKEHQEKILGQVLDDLSDSVGRK